MFHAAKRAVDTAAVRAKASAQTTRTRRTLHPSAKCRTLAVLPNGTIEASRQAAFGNDNIPCLSFVDLDEPSPILRAAVNSLKNVGSLA